MAAPTPPSQEPSGEGDIARFFVSFFNFLGAFFKFTDACFLFTLKFIFNMGMPLFICWCTFQVRETTWLPFAISSLITRYYVMYMPAYWWD
jgi:hypothetical protein